MNLSEQYWDNLYDSKQTGWDIGHVSTPLKEYFDQLKDRSISILVPGAGRAWEAEYVFQSGFKNTYVLDFSKNAIEEFKKRCPGFPESQLICQDFYKHSGKYDLIVEQTFFSSLLPEHRAAYAKQVYDLLNDGGKFVGLLFNHEFSFTGPPFGGTHEEYEQLFKPYFEFDFFETAINSIAPRKGRELFFLMRKK